MVSLDYGDYATLPQFGVRVGVAFGRELISAAPQDGSALVKRALDEVVATHRALEQAWQPVAKSGEAPSPKQLADRGLDGAWAAIDMRLGAWERLPSGVYPEVALAAEVRRTLLPDGLGFTQLPYREQWAESDWRVRLIDTDDLGETIEALAGPVFLAELRTAHARYGVALGITEAAPDEDEVPTSMRDHWRAFRDAVKQYVLRLFGTLDETDPAAVAAVKKAVRPIGNVRDEIMRGRGGATSSAEAPVAPLPVAEPAG